MNIDRLNEILSRMEGLAIGVVGDFFLDLYLDLDASLSETSIETGLEAYQAVNRRCQPGAAGNTAVNLVALRAGSVRAVGAIGDDGNGFDLRRALEDCGVDCSALIAEPKIFTPTYTKPLMSGRNGTTRELNRIDIKNRSTLPVDVENILLEKIGEMSGEVDGIVVIDQAKEPDCGSVTSRIREYLARLAGEKRGMKILVDSRCRITQYANCILKPNIAEALNALGMDSGCPDEIEGREIAGGLFAETGRPVFLTMGERGCCVADANGIVTVPAFSAKGEIDPVGAGDSFMAAAAASLCAGADHLEAAFMGNLAASITVGKIGTTGAAAPEELRAKLERDLL